MSDKKQRDNSFTDALRIWKEKTGADVRPAKDSSQHHEILEIQREIREQRAKEQETQKKKERNEKAKEKRKSKTPLSVKVEKQKKQKIKIIPEIRIGDEIKSKIERKNVEAAAMKRASMKEAKEAAKIEAKEKKTKKTEVLSEDDEVFPMAPPILIRDGGRIIKEPCGNLPKVPTNSYEGAEPEKLARSPRVKFCDQIKGKSEEELKKKAASLSKSIAKLSMRTQEPDKRPLSAQITFYTGRLKTIQEALDVMSQRT
jgi:hypothetical protein